MLSAGRGVSMLTGTVLPACNVERPSSRITHTGRETWGCQDKRGWGRRSVHCCWTRRVGYFSRACYRLSAVRADGRAADERKSRGIATALIAM